MRFWVVKVIQDPCEEVLVRSGDSLVQSTRTASECGSVYCFGGYLVSRVHNGRTDDWDGPFLRGFRNRLDLQDILDQRYS